MLEDLANPESDRTVRTSNLDFGTEVPVRVGGLPPHLRLAVRVSCVSEGANEPLAPELAIEDRETLGLPGRVDLESSRIVSEYCLRGNLEVQEAGNLGSKRHPQSRPRTSRVVDSDFSAESDPRVTGEPGSRVVRKPTTGLSAVLYEAVQRDVPDLGEVVRRDHDLIDADTQRKNLDGGGHVDRLCRRSEERGHEDEDEHRQGNLHL